MNGEITGAFVLFDLVLICYDVMNILLFENDKTGKFRMIRKGIIAGLRNTRGRA